MRVYNPTFAAVKRLNSPGRCLRAKSRASRFIYRAEVAVARNFGRTLCIALVVVLLATSSPTAVPTVVGVAKDAERTAVSWLRTNALSTKLYRGVAYGYVRYRSLSTSLDSGNTQQPAEASKTAAVAALLSPALVVLDAPTNLTVTATTSTSISLSWTAPAGTVDYYQIERSQSPSGPFPSIDTGVTTSFGDTTVTTNSAYLYRVRAVSSGTPSSPSNMALGTAISFTDNPLVSGVTAIKGQHINELRQSVNAVRGVAGLGAASWTDVSLPGVPPVFIKAVHIQELRDRLGEALAALSVPATAYTDPVLATGPSGTVVKKAHIEELRQRVSRSSSTSSGSLGSDLANARLDPLNRTGGGGEDPLSRNFNWSVPLVALPGRSGLDLGLSLSYNSLVWTRSGSFISFDDDQGFPSPGFRLGFPVIQPQYFNSEVGKWAYLLITPGGERVELRQVGISALYEAADSSHLLLDSSASPMILRSTDGTQLRYVWKGSDFQCTEIKDRNGNFIAINYTAFGRISTVVDTLGRIITFNYDGGNFLTSITQLWNGQTLPWASFEYYPALEFQTDFQGLINLGPQNGTTIKALSKVTLRDNSRAEFDYTYWGQIWKIRNYATDGHLLNYRAYNLPGNQYTPQTDCPRFTERHDWVKNWNRSGPNGVAGLPTGPEQEVLTASYAIPVSTSWTLPGGTPQSGMRAQVTLPDGTYQKIYFHGTAGTTTGWHRGLSSMVETFDSFNALQKQSVTTWTQDNTTVSYPLNPRVTETNVYDPSGNRRRMTAGYASFTLPSGNSCKLPNDIREYAANATTELRRTETDYRMNPTADASYLNRHIIGLVKEQRLYGLDAGVEKLMSQMGFEYDGSAIEGTVAPVNHDNDNYSPSFVVGRGNLTSVKRFDVSNTSVFVTSSSKYNRAGSVVETTDPANHTVTISYTDRFAANGTTLDPGLSFATVAYPTAVTDPDGYSFSIRYNYDLGAVTWKQTPLPSTIANTPGPEQKTTYDSVGRVERVTNLVNNAYTRFTYGPNYVQTFGTVNNVADETQSLQVFDGAGRVIAKASNHPSSTGGFSGQLVHYDVMGRPDKQSNPTETSISISGVLQPYNWQAAGDDALAGWVYMLQTYDWKGRPRITTNTDTTTKEASYSGCGCAGGEVVTLTDEVGRRQKIYRDVLGRAAKNELLNWDGSIYSATVNTYNPRDQVTTVKQYKGVATSDGTCPTNGTCQQSTMDYDGHSRLKTRHLPEQQVDPNNGTSTSHTTWDYFNDDTIQKVTDARGASQTFSYNGRHLVRTIDFFAPTGVTETADVEYQYDAAGNRFWMTDGLGRVDYVYNTLSRLTQERRQFAVGTFNIDYQYNLAGQLTKVTDPFGASFDYERNSQGQLTAVTGTPFTGVTTYVADVDYRAWGAPKSVSYSGGSGSTIAYNARMQPKEFRGFVREDYSYFGDGRLATLTDLDDTAGTNPPVTLRFLSRQYSYDHVGRTTGGHGGTGGGVPYSQSYSYDEFGNMTGRTGSYYNYNNSLPATDTALYIDNRRSGWSYNADGQVVGTPASSTDNPRSMSYDAAGRMVTSIDAGPLNTVTYSASYDGDGQLAHETSTTSPGSSETSYIVRSTVLGDVLTRLDQWGGKKITHVPAEGLSFATQRSTGGPGPYVHATQRNPLGITETGQAVYDPLGNYIPFQAHGDPRPPAGSYTSASMSGLSASLANPHSYGVGCFVDRLPTNCSLARRLLSSELADPCPNNDCGPRSNPNRDGPGRRGWEIPRSGPNGLFYDLMGPSARPRLSKPFLKRATRVPGADPARNPYTDDDEEEPQDTEVLSVDPGGIRNALDRMLRIGGCGAFVEGLINRLAADTKNPFVSDYALDLFDAVESGKGGFVRGGLANKNRVGATISGGINSRNAAIHLTSHFEFGSSDPQVRANAVNFIDAFQSLHELVHLAGSKRYYSDTQIAKTLSNWLGIPGLPVRKKGESERDFIGRNSGYFSSVLSTKCPVLSR